MLDAATPRDMNPRRALICQPVSLAAPLPPRAPSDTPDTSRDLIARLIGQGAA